MSEEYVDGDVNVVTPSASAEDAVIAPRVLEYVAKAMADEPEAVRVDVEEHGRGVKLSLHVSPADMGRVIGRRGRTAQALRTLIAAAGTRDGVATNVDIVD